MSFGKMTTFIDIFKQIAVKDSDGFSTQVDDYVASVRADREERHGSKKWANMATYTSADALFKFRRVPGLEVKSGMILVTESERYEIVSVENIKGLYIEVSAEKMKPTEG